jgi:hypothetical protein
MREEERRSSAEARREICNLLRGRACSPAAAACCTVAIAAAASVHRSLDPAKSSMANWPTGAGSQSEPVGVIFSAYDGKFCSGTVNAEGRIILQSSEELQKNASLATVPRRYEAGSNRADLDARHAKVSRNTTFASSNHTLTSPVLNNATHT